MPAIDWASSTHGVGVVDDQGGVRARFQVPNTGKGFGGLIRRLVKLQVTGVAIERPDGPLVEAMLDAGLRVVVIAPRQVKALRSRDTAAGASRMLLMRCCWLMCCVPTVTAWRR
jgi:transposase